MPVKGIPEFGWKNYAGACLVSLFWIVCFFEVGYYDSVFDADATSARWNREVGADPGSYYQTIGRDPVLWKDAFNEVGHRYNGLKPDGLLPSPAGLRLYQDFDKYNGGSYKNDDQIIRYWLMSRDVYLQKLNVAYFVAHWIGGLVGFGMAGGLLILILRHFSRRGATRSTD
jgi:hypothetical protein